RRNRSRASVPGGGETQAATGQTTRARGDAPGDAAQGDGGGTVGVGQDGRLTVVGALAQRDVERDLPEQRDLRADGAGERVGDRLATAGAEELLPAAVGQL